MKTLKEIAEVILERRARMNPTIMHGELSDVIGSEGLAEAINRRWLIPNYESGYLQVASFGEAVQEMQDLAQMPEAAAVPDVLAESRPFAVQHAVRKCPSISEAMTLSEIAAPATGRPSPSFTMQTSTSTPTSSAPQNRQMGVGDEVSVVENGKAFVGRIRSNENGRFRLSFGTGEKPTDRDYTDKELNHINAQNPPVR